MNRYSYLIFLCVFFCKNSKAALIQLKVTTPSVFQVNYTLNPQAEEPIYYRITLDRAKGDAIFPVDVQEAQFVIVQYGSTQFSLFLEPHYDLKMYFDGQNPLKTVRFDGEGAENNNCLAQFKRNFREDGQTQWRAEYLNPNIDKMTEKRAKQTDADSYSSIVNSDKDAEIQFLDSWQANIHKKVYSYLWKDVIYMRDMRLYAYILIFDFLTKSELNTIYNKFFSTHSFNYTDYEQNDTDVFFNTLKAYIHTQMVIAKMEFSENALYEVIGKKLSGFDRFKLQKVLLIEVFEKKNDPTLARQKFEAYAKECPYKEFIKEIQTLYDNQLNVFIKEQAPNIEYETADGQVSKLSNLRGKVVYISFWASWCKPCLDGFQKYDELRHKLMTEGVILLNLNIDDDLSKYRATLNRLTITGINAQPIDIPKAKQLYNLYSIPAYYIVDKQGNFAKLPQKEGRDVVGEFRKLVGE